MTTMDMATPSSSVIVLDDDEEIDKPTPRQIFTFMIQTGIRAGLKNRSVCTAILLMHRVICKEEFIKDICLHTLSTACLMIALKYEEDRGITIRRVCHTAQSIISDQMLTENSEEIKYIADGVGRLEFLVLREVGYKMVFQHPHTHLALMLQSLRSWMEEEFEKFAICETAYSILRDCYISPELISGHQPKSIAIAVLSLALKTHDVTVPLARSEWHEAFSSYLSSRKLRSLEKEILREVYEVDVD